MGEILMASFSKIWHLIPIAIAIVLFKMFIDKRDKKKRVQKNEENEKSGLTLQVRTINKYEEMGYTIQEIQENKQGIDFIMSKGDKTLLVHCNDISESKSIKEEEIKAFYKNAMNYAKENDMVGMNMELRYVIPYMDVLHKSAVKILKDDAYGCKYVIV